MATHLHAHEAVAACLSAVQRISEQTLAEQSIDLDKMGMPLQPLEAAQLTPFHSSIVPPMTVLQYASRVATYSGYGLDGLIYGLVLMARYTSCTDTFPSLLTVHRLLLVCTAVAMKANSDFFYKNVYVAQAGGVPTKELNRLEKELLIRVHFSVMVTAAEVRRLLHDLPAVLAAGGDVKVAFKTIAAAIDPLDSTASSPVRGFDTTAPAVATP
jgi:hypothetical protein